MIKECSRCLEEKELAFFNKNRSSLDGYRSTCKLCTRKYGAKYYSSNKEHISAQRKIFYKKEGVAQARAVKNKIWYQKNANKRRKQTSAYAKANRLKYSQYSKAFYIRNKNNARFIIGSRLRTRIWKALKGKSKKLQLNELVGCSLQELKVYLESKFTPGMSWDNYGYRGWHIDHIKPLSSFDLSDPEELTVACHYTNLQPLWWRDNLVKSNKYCGEC